jgi:hypothetical protein
MQSHHIGPEVTAFMQSCERVFGLIHENGKLSALEVEVLHYYSRELLEHLSPSPSNLSIPTPPSPTPPENASTKDSAIDEFAEDSPTMKLGLF